MDIYNNQSFMIEFRKQITGVNNSIFIKTFPEWKKICLHFALEDNSKRLIFDFNNVYYLLNSLCNFVSLICLNDNNIYHDNKNRALYYYKTRRVLGQTKYWKNSYLLRSLNLSDIVVHLLHTNDNVYQRPMVF